MTNQLLFAVLILAVGTYALRAAGPVLHARWELSDRARQLLSISAVTLLTALVATAALFDAHDIAGVARPAGVAVGGVLAWKRAPFVIVVVAAAATAAGLRAVGIP